MRRTVFAALAIALVVPMAGANPVTHCMQQCRPLDADANGPAPHEGAEVSTSILYPHFQDLLNRAPTNLQLPDALCEPDLNGGMVAPTASTRTNTDADLRFENNWFYGATSAGFVEFGADCTWRTHMEPGFAADVELAGGTATLYVYVSAYPVPGQSTSTGLLGHNAPDVMAQVGVYARWETGRFSFHGTLIAEGDTGNGDVAGLAAGPGRVNLVTLPGQPDVYEVAVPLALKTSTIPHGAAGSLLSVNVYQLKVKDGALAGTQAAQGDWRFHTGPATPPHLVFETTHPLRTTGLGAVAAPGGGFQVDWSLVSPWGSYDLTPASLRGEATFPDGSTHAVPVVSMTRSVDHDGHFKPTDVVFGLPGPLPTGHYKVEVSALNLQGTYRLADEAGFDL